MIYDDLKDETTLSKKDKTGLYLMVIFGVGAIGAVTVACLLSLYFNRYKPIKKLETALLCIVAIIAFIIHLACIHGFTTMKDQIEAMEQRIVQLQEKADKYDYLKKKTEQLLQAGLMYNY